MTVLGIRFTSAGHLAYAAVTLILLAAACANGVVELQGGRADPILAVVGCLVHAWVGIAAHLRLNVSREAPEYGFLGVAPDCIWYNALLAVAYGGLLWMLWA